MTLPAVAAMETHPNLIDTLQFKCFSLSEEPGLESVWLNVNPRSNVSTLTTDCGWGVGRAPPDVADADAAHVENVANGYCHSRFERMPVCALYHHLFQVLTRLTLATFHTTCYTCVR